MVVGVDKARQQDLTAGAEHRDPGLCPFARKLSHG
jgi:hypothetical protein